MTTYTLFLDIKKQENGPTLYEGIVRRIGNGYNGPWGSFQGAQTTQDVAVELARLGLAAIKWDGPYEAELIKLPNQPFHLTDTGWVKVESECNCSNPYCQV